jgi:hypothetical protein
MVYWMILGDFNFIRTLDDSSRLGDSNNMMSFNTIIHAHELEEIPLKGRAFT